VIQTDVLIVGGGPAGASCAWALNRYGAKCIVLDRESFPREKLCAGWITSDVLMDLEIEPADYPHTFVTIPTLQISVRGARVRLPGQQRAIRRIEFDEWLLRRSGAPVHVHHARKIEQRDGGYVVDDEFFAPFIVGAAGTHCPVARTFFDEVNPRSPDALIVAQEEEFPYPYAEDGWGDACHLWFLEEGLPGYAWYVPKGDGIVNVGVGGKAVTLQSQDRSIQEHWELLVARLARIHLVEGYDFKPKGHAYYLREEERRLREGDAFVIGDAAGLATADMGEGIAPAVRSGLLVAETIVAGGEIDMDAIRRYSQPPVFAQILARAYGSGT
jgi:menaquinone-9 beta-reductase